MHVEEAKQAVYNTTDIDILQSLIDIFKALSNPNQLKEALFGNICHSSGYPLE